MCIRDRIYSTKDDAKFGFYQETNQEQTAFTKFQDKTAYLKLSDLLMLKNHLLKAQEHLISRGASIDNYWLFNNWIKCDY